MTVRELTPDEVAARSGFKKSTLKKWRRTGDGPPFKRRRRRPDSKRWRIRYPEDQFEAWLSSVRAHAHTAAADVADSMVRS